MSALGCIVQHVLNGGGIGVTTEIDDSYFWFTIEGYRIFVHPVGNIVGIEQETHIFDLLLWNHDVRPGIPVGRYV